MRRYRYLGRASLEIAQITDFTNANWGADQAKKYIDELEELCQQLTRLPNLGRLVGAPHPETRKIQFKSHVIYYDVSDNFIDIRAVIHKNQVPKF